ncbi:MAG: UDP-3-O-(3-hydroxymyristoyl)glucosamine N-acyltransferase [Planctomycetota bacterium]
MISVAVVKRKAAVRLDEAITLGDLARASGARLRGDPQTKLKGLSSLANALPDEISFARSAERREEALASRAGALLVGEDFGDLDRPGLVAGEVDAALALVGEFLVARALPPPAPGVDDTAVVAQGVTMGEGASVGPLAVLEVGVSLGPRARVGAGCFVGRGAAIGPETILHANVTVGWGCALGARCIVHSGAVIGADGFGYGKNDDGSYRKIPQLGNVVVADDVEIGACSCIDRATIDSTVIESGVKIDNLVHIAHNCRVGRDTAMAALVGIAGSTKIGARSVFGGQAGAIGHITIGEGVSAIAKTGITRSFGDGVELAGMPARERAKVARELAFLKRAEEIVKDLRDRVRSLEGGTGGPSGDGGAPGKDEPRAPKKRRAKKSAKRPAKKSAKKSAKRSKRRGKGSSRSS